MKNNMWRSFHAATLASSLVLSLALSSGAQSVPRNSFAARSLEGTWTVQVQIVDCASGAALGNPFASLLTFARGGTETDTTANPMFFPAERSPGHGVWRKTGKRTYASTDTAFITLNGTLAKTQKISQQITMTNGGESFTSIASIEFFDPAGNLLGNGCATAVAQYFK